MYANMIRGRVCAIPGRCSEWMETCRQTGEADDELADRNLDDEVFPEVALADTLLYSEWMSGGQLVSVETAKNTGESAENFKARHRQAVKDKLEDFPIDT